MYSINLSWVWVDTICIVKAAKEIDSLRLYMCVFCWIEHQVIFAGNMHKIVIGGHHVLPWCSCEQ